MSRRPVGALIFSTVRLCPEPEHAAEAHLLDSNALRTHQLHRVDVDGLEVVVSRREKPPSRDPPAPSCAAIRCSSSHEVGRASIQQVVLNPVTTDTPALPEEARREKPGIGALPCSQRRQTRHRASAGGCRATGGTRPRHSPAWHPGGAVAGTCSGGSSPRVYSDVSGHASDGTGWRRAKFRAMKEERHVGPGDRPHRQAATAMAPRSPNS